MKVQMRDISSVTPYEKNPRINDAAVDAVESELRVTDGGLDSGADLNIERVTCSAAV